MVLPESVKYTPMLRGALSSRFGVGTCQLTKSYPPDRRTTVLARRQHFEEAVGGNQHPDDAFVASFLTRTAMTRRYSQNRNQSIRAPDCLMTFAHFTSSDLIYAANCSREFPTGTRPSSLKRCFTSAACTIFTTCVLSELRMSSGVPAGPSFGLSFECFSNRGASVLTIVN